MQWACALNVHRFTSVHLLQEASEPSSTSVDNQAEPFRAALDRSVQAYAKDHYPNGVVTVSNWMSTPTCTIMYIHVHCRYIIIDTESVCTKSLMCNTTNLTNTCALCVHVYTHVLYVQCTCTYLYSWKAKMGGGGYNVGWFHILYMHACTSTNVHACITQV